MTPQNRAPTALHPRTLPTTLPYLPVLTTWCSPPSPGSHCRSLDPLCFCGRGTPAGEGPGTACPWGPLQTNKGKHPAPSIFCRLCLMGVLSIPGDKILVQHFTSQISRLTQEKGSHSQNESAACRTEFPSWRVAYSL